MGNTDFDRKKMGKQDMKAEMKMDMKVNDTRGQQQHNMWSGSERRMAERRAQASSGNRQVIAAADPIGGQSSR